MEIENAKRLIPQWAEIEPVRVYEPKKKQPERRTGRERRRTPKLPDLSWERRCMKNFLPSAKTWATLPSMANLARTCRWNPSTTAR